MSVTKVSSSLNYENTTALASIHDAKDNKEQYVGFGSNVTAVAKDTLSLQTFHSTTALAVHNTGILSHSEKAGTSATAVSGLEAELGTTNLSAIEHFKNILDKNPNYFLTTSPKLWATKFCMLLFQAPDHALAILKNEKNQFNDITLGGDFEFKFKNLALLGVSIRLTAPFAQCVDLLSLNKSIKPETFQYMLESTIQKDLPDVALALARAAQVKVWDMEVCNTIIRWDSCKCLAAFHEHWKGSGQTACYIEALQVQVIDFNSPQCLTYLIKIAAITVNLKNLILIQAAKKGYLQIVLVLHQNKLYEAAVYLFKGLDLANGQFNKEALEPKLLSILRMSPLVLVDQCVKAYVEKLPPATQSSFQEIYGRVKGEFLKLAPFISRYTRNELYQLNSRYKPNTQTLDQTQTDLAYASSCRLNVEGILQELKIGKLKAPSDKAYKALPKSQHASQRVAAILEVIVKLRYQTQEKRNPEYPELEQFKTLRTLGHHTGIAGIYQWAAPLSSSMYHLSQAPDSVFEGTTCFHNYKGIQINKFHGEAIGRPVGDLTRPTLVWKHGYSPTQATWGSIEDVFEDILSLKIEKPSDQSETATKKYQKSIEIFYEKAAELVWLIGNTQPVNRGSGTFAEWMLALIHLHHDLPIPVLKTDYPQLDVLDIIFPLSDFRGFFRYFFEPETIACSLYLNLAIGMPLYDQMNAFYRTLPKNLKQAQARQVGIFIDQVYYPEPAIPSPEQGLQPIPLDVVSPILSPVQNADFVLPTF